jgi:hypothetical protein
MFIAEKIFAWPSGFSPSLLLCMALLFPLSLFGAEQPNVTVPLPDTSAPQPETPAPQTAAPEQQPDLLDTIDAPRDYLSEQLIGFASSIDRFFGDDRNYQESNQSVFQMDLARMTGYGGDRKFVLSGRARLHLPSTEKHLHLLLETDPEKNVTAAPTQGQPLIGNQIVTPGSYAAAVRYEKQKEEETPWHFSADAGIKFQGIHLNPFARTRGSYSIPLDQWRLKAYESVYWFNTIGAGETTQLDLEHILSESSLFRASSNATWLNDKQNFDLSQSFSIYHTVSERTAMLYQASAIGVSNPQYQVTDYVVLMLYRYRLHRKWIFFELSPQLHFPKTNNFQSSFALSMRLEMLFDGSK